MRTVLGGIAIALQVTFFVLLAFYLFGYLDWYYGIDWSRADLDPRDVSRLMAQPVFEIVLAGLGALVGVFLTWFCLRVDDFTPTWYVSVSRVVALAWFLVFPLGTLFGGLLLHWSRPGFHILGAR